MPSKGAELATSLIGELDLGPTTAAKLREYFQFLDALQGFNAKNLRDIQDSAPIKSVYKRRLTAAEGGFDVNPLSSAFEHLQIYIRGRGTAVAQSVAMHLNFNGDSGANYEWQYVAGEQAVASAAYDAAATKIIMGNMVAASAPASEFDNFILHIPFYRSSTRKGALILSQTYRNTNTKQFAQYVVGWWEVADPISRLQFTPSSGNLDIDSQISVIGLR